jgi:hypothetical protein
MLPRNGASSLTAVQWCLKSSSALKGRYTLIDFAKIRVVAFVVAVRRSGINSQHEDIGVLANTLAHSMASMPLPQHREQTNEASTGLPST